MALVDSGWSYGIEVHRVVQGRAFDLLESGSVRISAEVSDRLGHGTLCGRLLLSASRRSVLLPLRIFSGLPVASPTQLIASLDWLIKHPPDVAVFCIAMGILPEANLVATRCAELAAKGTRLVASISNDGTASIPADLESVVSVGLSGQRLESELDVAFPSDEVESALLRAGILASPSASFAAALMAARIADELHQSSLSDH